MRILIMGLPGAGKTTLAEALVRRIDEAGRSVLWLNADKIRTVFNDWDFSEEGRLRQAHRMRSLCNGADNDIKIADFVAPLPIMRDIFEADYTIWVDTIVKGRFSDTNAAFVPPEKYDVKVTSQDAEKWASIILSTIVLN